jgi:hypothetical protein
MAAYLSTELGGSANQTSAPVGYKPRATVYGARLKRLRASFVYNSQATTDTLVVGNLPAGATFAFGVLTADTSSGTTTLAIGTAASNAKYKAAAAFTTTDTPTIFGKTAVVGAADPGLTAEEQVIVTLAAAGAPASGNLVVDLYYSMPN